MSGLPILIRGETVRSAGLPARRVEQRFVPSGDGSRLRAGYDLWVARRCGELLHAAYPGHFWEVIADSGQGYVGIRIPILMGGNWAYIIKWKDLSPRQVMHAGGEILERYRLPRDKFELGAFLEARQRHSILVNPSRKVPG